MTKGEIVKFIIEVLILPIAVWGVNTIDKVNQNVAQLNTKVGIIIDKTDRSSKEIEILQRDNKNLSDRVLILEQKGK